MVVGVVFVDVVCCVSYAVAVTVYALVVAPVVPSCVVVPCVVDGVKVRTRVKEVAMPLGNLLLVVDEVVAGEAVAVGNVDADAGPTVFLSDFRGFCCCLSR